jgi:hypothetical protein
MHIEYTDQALKEKMALLEYIAELHSYSVSTKVEEEIDACIQALLIFPYQWPIITTKRNLLLHKAIVNERTIILYKVEKVKIVLFDILDARSDWL